MRGHEPVEATPADDSAELAGSAWLRLAVWEIWMGMLLCLVLGFGVRLIVTSPDHIIAFSDLSTATRRLLSPFRANGSCIEAAMLNAAFTALFGAHADRRRRVVPVGVVERGRAEADHRRLPEAAQRLVRPRLAQPAHLAVGASVLGVRLHRRRRDLGGRCRRDDLDARRLSEPAKAPASEIETSETFRLGQ